MRLRHGFILLIVYLISVQPAFAQAQKTNLTIGKLIERVIKYNSDISISKNNLRIANLEYRETLADNAPTLTLDETGYEVTKRINELINKFEFGLEYSQNLPTSGSLHPVSPFSWSEKVMKGPWQTLPLNRSSP